MDIENLTKEILLKNMTPEQQKAVLESVRSSVMEARVNQRKKVAENVDLVIQALKKIEGEIRDRYDLIGSQLEKRISNIKDGRDGNDGRDGRDGKDGKPGKNGKQGPAGRNGKDGKNGIDGLDGVSVISANIDFDGSLIIKLSNGHEINAGEVVPLDLAERIKIIGNGGGTSQTVLDTLDSLQAQIDSLIPSQTGNAGKVLTTDGSTLSWTASISGGLSYQGTWNASTNTPTLASATGTNGYYYVVGVSGSTNLDGISDWVAGDWLLFNGSNWQKIDQTNLVTSVNSQTGAVTLTASDVGAATSAQGALADSAVQPGDNISSLTNDSGYLTSYTETDPVFVASPAYGITSTNITNWDTAYGWGNHASAGYLTFYTESDPIYTTSSWYSTTNNSSNWDTAYSWGNHASAGYATDSDVVHNTGNESVAGIKTFTDNVQTDAIVDSSGGNTATINGYTPTASNMAGKNRIINGAMMIDQRKTASTAVTTSNLYVTDRFSQAFGNALCSFQQVTDAPSGFVNSLKLTVTTGSAPSAGTNNVILQKVEGLNVADFAFGSASAVTTTLSFWVKGSVTGTYAVSFTNSAFNRSYVATYTINASNTWEQKTITISGDTTGTWLKTNGVGLTVIWDFGSGTNLNTTAGSWQAGNYYRTSACTTIASTTNATLQITGIQLEVGSVATPFENRLYGTELALCQRYFEILPTGGGIYGSTANVGYANWQYKVTKRGSPAVTLASGSLITAFDYTNEWGCSGYRNGYPYIAGGTTSDAEL